VTLSALLESEKVVGLQNRKQAQVLVQVLVDRIVRPLNISQYANYILLGAGLYTAGREFWAFASFASAGTARFTWAISHSIVSSSCSSLSAEFSSLSYMLRIGNDSRFLYQFFYPLFPLFLLLLTTFLAQSDTFLGTRIDCIICEEHK
jgi:hypothetical protein